MKPTENTQHTRHAGERARSLTVAMAVIAALTAPVSCTRNLERLGDAYADDTALVSLSLTVNAPISLTSISAEEAEAYESGSDLENYVDIRNGDYRIYIFTNDPDNNGNDTFLAYFNTVGYEANSDDTEYTVTGRMYGRDTDFTDFKVVVLANWGDAYPDITTGTTIDDLCEAAYTLSSNWKLGPGNYIPFYGVTAYSGVTLSQSENEITVLDDPINLIRAVAKIEIVTDYHFSSIVLHGCNETGYCAPSGVYSQDDYTDSDDYGTLYYVDDAFTVHIYGDSNDDTTASNLVYLMRSGDESLYTDSDSDEDSEDENGDDGEDGDDTDNTDNNYAVYYSSGKYDDDIGDVNLRSDDYLYVIGSYSNWGWTGLYNLYNYDLNRTLVYQGMIPSPGSEFKFTDETDYNGGNYGAGGNYGTDDPGPYNITKGSGINFSSYGYYSYYHFSVDLNSMVLTMDKCFNNCTYSTDGGSTTAGMFYNTSDQCFLSSVTLPCTVICYLDGTEITRETFSGSGTTTVYLDMNNWSNITLTDGDPVLTSISDTSKSGKGDRLYMTGAFNSWAFAGPYLYNYDFYRTDDYQGVVDFTSDYASDSESDGFKMTVVPDWNGKDYGSDATEQATANQSISISTSGGNIKVFESYRFYHFIANTYNLTIKADHMFDGCTMELNGETYDMTYLLSSQSFYADAHNIPDNFSGDAVFKLDGTTVHTQTLSGISGDVRVLLDINDSGNYIVTTQTGPEETGGGSGSGSDESDDPNYGAYYSNDTDGPDVEKSSRYYVPGEYNDWFNLTYGDNGTSYYVGPYLYQYSDKTGYFQGVVDFTSNYANYTNGFQITTSQGWSTAWGYGDEENTLNENYSEKQLTVGAGNICFYVGINRYLHLSITSSGYLYRDYGFDSITMNFDGNDYEMSYFLDYDQNFYVNLTDLPAAAGTVTFTLHNCWHGSDYSSEYTLPFQPEIETVSGNVCFYLDLNDLNNITLLTHTTSDLDPSDSESEDDFDNGHEHGADNNYTWYCYVPEFDNLSNANDNQAYIQLNPIGFETELKDYRVYFRDYDPDDPGYDPYTPGAEYDIRRNYIYRFNVTLINEELSVSETGYTTFHETYEFQGSATGD